MEDSQLLPVLARDIGVTLGAIHSISDTPARGAGISEMDVDELATKFGWVEAAFALRGLDPAVDLALEWLREVPLPVVGADKWAPSDSITVPFQGPLRLIHADVGVDHLIVDPMTGRLAGILDWTDSRLGDPAGDFVFAVTWKGWSFAEEVFRSYPHPVDAAFRERLVFGSRMLSIMYLTLAHLQHFDVASGIRGVRNAFAPAGAS